MNDTIPWLCIRFNIYSSSRSTSLILSYDALTLMTFSLCIVAAVYPHSESLMIVTLQPREAVLSCQRVSNESITRGFQSSLFSLQIRLRAYV